MNEKHEGERDCKTEAEAQMWKTNLRSRRVGSGGGIRWKIGTDIDVHVYYIK